MTADVQLRRVFRVVNGGTPSSDLKNWDGGVTWVTPGDLGKNDTSCIDQSARTLTEVGLSSSATLVPSRSLIISSRAPIGYVAIAGGPVAFNQGCKGLVARREIDSRYFYYQLLTRRKELQARGQGSTFGELSTDYLASTRVACPPVEQQRRIADFLDVQQRVFAMSATLLRRLRVLVSERLSVVAARLVENSACGSVRLKYMSTVQQGWSPDALPTPADLDEVGMLKLSAVSTARFRPEENRVVPAEHLAAVSWRRWELHDGDVLLTRASGSKHLVGRVCRVRGLNGRRAVFPDLIYRLLPADDQLDPGYLLVTLQAAPVRAALLERMRGSANNKIRIEDVRELSIPLPGLEEQRRMGEAYSVAESRTETLLERIDRQVALLAERREALITAAVTGQLDPPSNREAAAAA